MSFKNISKDIEQKFQEIIDMCGGIPCFYWLNENGYGNLLYESKKKGYTLPEIRLHFGLSENLRLISIDGKCWRSYPECAIANFFLARGITVSNGELYPPEFVQFSGLKKATYDMHFVSKDGVKINVEIWGGGIRYNDISYQNTKHKKIEFSKNDPKFIGIDYTYSYKEEKLEKIFSSYIGKRNIVYKHPIFPQILSTNISILNNFLKMWEIYKVHFKNEKMPSIDWFRRLAVYKNRVIQEWEPVTFSLFVWHITKLGGMFEIRKIIKQDRHKEYGDKCIVNAKYLFEKTNCTPGNLVKKLHKKGEERTEEENELYKLACNTASWAKYVGGHGKLCKLAGIDQNTLCILKTQTRRNLYLQQCKDVYDKYKKVPGTIRSELYAKKNCTEEEKKLRTLCAIIIHQAKYYGGARKMYEKAGIICTNPDKRVKY